MAVSGKGDDESVVKTDADAKASSLTLDEDATAVTTVTTPTEEERSDLQPPSSSSSSGRVRHGTATVNRPPLRFGKATCVASALLTLAFLALEGGRRRRQAMLVEGFDPDEELLKHSARVLKMAEQMYQENPSERNRRHMDAAMEETRRLSGQLRQRKDAEARAEAWKERVRVRKAGEAGATADDDKKPPLAGSSAKWVSADARLRELLEERVAERSIAREEDVVEDVPHVEVVSEAAASPIVEEEEEVEETKEESRTTKDTSSEEYPPELVEAMKRMEADIATGKFSEEALFEKYKDVLDKFGEEFDPEDDGDADEHPQLLDPYWWRNSRALHLITITRDADSVTQLFALQMVPDSIPERARPDDKYHVVAFESRSDAENFCFLMQSKRGDPDLDEDLRGLVSIKGIGPKELQRVADDVDYGVTVVGAGRIDLSPNRSHVDVLNHVVHIGGEAYLWDFARQVKRDFDDEVKREEQEDK